MTSLCCPSVQPYRDTNVDHEAKFRAFLSGFPSAAPISYSRVDDDPAFIIQLVTQVNHGPVLSKRYFSCPTRDVSGAPPFTEVVESDLITRGFERVRSFKNFRCGQHNRFFELNLYMPNPNHKRPARDQTAGGERPSGEIDV